MEGLIHLYSLCPRLPLTGPVLVNPHLSYLHETGQKPALYCRMGLRMDRKRGIARSRLDLVQNDGF